MAQLFAEEPTTKGTAKSLAAAETAFARESVEKGMRTAFLNALSEDSVVFSPGPQNGRQVWRAKPESESILDWKPILAAVSSKGDLGYTTGPWTLKKKASDPTPVAFGQFVSIWRWESGKWKMVFDLGSDNPEPNGPAPEPTEPATHGRPRPAKSGLGMPESFSFGRLRSIPLHSTNFPYPTAWQSPDFFLQPGSLRWRMVASELLNLSGGERLRVLRALDVFHPWSSIDDQRFCRRCGEMITGRQILIYSHWQEERPGRLECPTKGCLAVPLDWIILEEETKPTTDRIEPSIDARVEGPKSGIDTRCFDSSRVFSFLRAPRAFF